MEEERRADQIVSYRQLLSKYVESEELDRRRGPGRRASRIKRDGTHVAAVQLHRHPPTLGTTGQLVQDVTAATSHIEDSDGATLPSVKAKDFSPDSIGCEGDAVDAREGSECLEMAGPFETRIIHELRPTAPNGEINGARH